MGEAASYSVVTGSRSLVRQRLLVRRDRVVLPFVWRGLLPMLGLGLVFLYAVWPFAHGEIEANVKRSITQAFAEKGMDGVKVNVSGQHVLLTGQLKPGFNTLDALSIARNATCPTWLGPQICAELVIGNFESLPSLPSAPALPALPAVPAKAPEAPSVAERETCEKTLAAAVSKQHIEFASGSARLLPSSAKVLDEVAKAHASCKGVVRVEGHTDNVGDAELNARLSLDRANAVRQELVKRGIAENSLVAEGFGPSKPVADNATADGRQQNRRIDFKVVVPN